VQMLEAKLTEVLGVVRYFSYGIYSCICVKWLSKSRSQQQSRGHDAGLSSRPGSANISSFPISDRLITNISTG